MFLRDNSSSALLQEQMAANPTNNVSDRRGSNNRRLALAGIGSNIMS